MRKSASRVIMAVFMAVTMFISAIAAPQFSFIAAADEDSSLPISFDQDLVTWGVSDNDDNLSSDQAQGGVQQDQSGEEDEDLEEEEDNSGLSVLPLGYTTLRIPQGFSLGSINITKTPYLYFGRLKITGRPQTRGLDPMGDNEFKFVNTFGDAIVPHWELHVSATELEGLEHGRKLPYDTIGYINEDSQNKDISELNGGDIIWDSTKDTSAGDEKVLSWNYNQTDFGFVAEFPAELKKDSYTAAVTWTVLYVPLIPGNVYYDANGGTGGYAADVVVDTEYAIEAPDNIGVSRADYDFVEWNTEPDGSGTAYNPGDEITIPDYDITVYAQWEYTGPLYSVTYIDDDGAVAETFDDIMPGTMHTTKDPWYDLNIPTITSFEYWSTEPDGAGDRYGVGEPITVDSNITLYGNWKLGYDVCYYKNYGGTSDGFVLESFATNPYTVWDAAMAAANNFAKADNTLVSWNTKADGTGTAYDLGERITLTESLDLYAQWKPSSYQVHYYKNHAELPDATGLEQNATNPYTVWDAARTAQVANFVPTNHTLVSWNTQANGSGTTYQPGGVIELTEELRLYAQWKEDIKYTITYHDMDGNPISPDGIFGSLVTGDTHMVKTYTDLGLEEITSPSFVYWSVDPKGSGGVIQRPGMDYIPGESITIGSADVNLYWQGKYQVTYNSNTPPPVSVSFDELLYSAMPYTVWTAEKAAQHGSEFTRAGYILTGWNTRQNGKGTAYGLGEIVAALPGNITLFAQWESTEPVYDVSYYMNYDGTSGGVVQDLAATSPYTVWDAAKAAGESFAKDDYILVGWNTQADGNGTHYDFSQITTLTSNLDLYAQWEEVEQVIFRVTYKSDGNDTGDKFIERFIPPLAPEQQIVSPGWFAQAPIAKEGYTFNNWNSKPDGSGTWYTPDNIVPLFDGAGNPSANIVLQETSPMKVYELELYAQWISQNYKVTYDSNDAPIGAALTDTVPIANVDYTIRNKDILGDIWAGYIIFCWTTNADGSGTMYMPGDTTILTGNLYLYAQWESSGSNDLTITYHDQNGNALTTAGIFGSLTTGETHTVRHYLAVGMGDPLPKVFVYWSTNSDGSGDHYVPGDILTMGTADVDLYGQVVSVYQVRYDSRHPKGSVPDGIAFDNGVMNPYTVWDAEQVNTHNLDCLGYTLTGWNTQQNGTGTAYAPGAEITLTGDLRLYAQWKAS